MARGRLDGVAYLYILLGIPAMVGFFVVLFVLGRMFNLPA
jgi:hypothetical protein